MHFWIDKPTGRCPRIHGRRYRMNVPKSHFASHHHHRYAIDDVAGLHMFPPLPRFQSNDVSSAGPSNNNNNTRSLRPTAQESVDRTDAAQPGCHQLGQDNISNIHSNNTGNNQRVLPQSTNDTNRGLLNVLECNEADMRVYNVGITLVTVIAFLAVTRFYFDYQQSEGIQVFVIFGLLAFLLLYRCIIRILCPTVPSSHHHHHQETTPVSDPIATVTVLNTISNESISDVPMPIRQNPPPPYHIAILIPPPASADEAPPPAYDKIIH
ncbi:uncharacterized protein LOC106644840 [Copidosoma floridanum]|uniref:uncharacterized protein LOC106644840 n=1 Tax=Copidosoma floridanum TaxID=29053 RepID=UPI0006C96B86|nr:uncharacterized protein LOC106644840 [Copidosoma floridanum]